MHFQACHTRAQTISQVNSDGQNPRQRTLPSTSYRHCLSAEASSRCQRPRSHRLCAPASAASENGSTPHVSTVFDTTVTAQTRKKQFSNANFPLSEDGRTYHLGTCQGEVANRILSVGSQPRAVMLSQFLEPPSLSRPGLFMLESPRGFLTITGRFQGVPITIVTTHMGFSNMDFVVRESSAVVDGEMAIVRLGTCGALQPPAHMGSVCVAPSSVFVRRDPDAFSGESFTPAYSISRPVAADPALTRSLVVNLHRHVEPRRIVEGLNASADSFYSSQGRTDSLFDDANEHLLAELIAKHPGAVSMEMETFHLLDLARVSRGRIRAGAAVIALAERHTNSFIRASEIEELERTAGLAVLVTLAECDLGATSGQLMAHNKSVQTVWE